MYNEIKLGILVLALGVIVAGCTFPWEKKRESAIPENTTATSTSIENAKSFTYEMKKFSSVEDLRIFLQKNALSGGITPVSGNLLDNNRVLSAEDADILKTDGKFIYTIVKNEILIIKAEPVDQVEVIGRISFKSAPENILISEGKLVVIGNDYKFYENSVSDSFKRRGNYILVKVFDVSSPDSPKELRSLNFEGSYARARLLGNFLYLMTSNYVLLDDEIITPRILENGKVVSNCSEAHCVNPNIYYFDAGYESYSLVSVNAISLNSKDPVATNLYLVNSPESLHVSKDNLYLTIPQSISERKIEQEIRRDKIFSKLNTEQQEKIKKIEASSSFILSPEEKEIKIANIFDEYTNSLDEAGKMLIKDEIDASLVGKIKSKMKELEKTLVYKIALKGGKPEYRAKGMVQGKLLRNALDEKNGNLRLVTTRNYLWSKLFEDSAKYYSNVYILDENLTSLGSLENIATEAQLQSARLMDSRAYLVTTDRNDPLYVIDLDEKTKPEILGAVKIPGYSTYLHSANKQGTKILGLGRDYEEVDGSVKVKGLKLSLFDFSDLAKPKELSSFSIGEESSQSIALSNSQAFLYSEEKNLISVPGVFEKDGKVNFSGALTFIIRDELLKLEGKINHLSSNPLAIYNDNNLVKRSINLGDNLFTVSNKYLKVNSLTDLKELKSVILTPGEEDYMISSGAEQASSTTPVENMPGVPAGDSSEVPAPTTLNEANPADELPADWPIFDIIEEPASGTPPAI